MLIYFVKRVRKISKFHVAVIQRRLRTYKKKRDARAELLFCWYKPVTFFPFLFAVAGVVKLPIVVIQKFCHHGNVTSYFSSLLMCHLPRIHQIMEYKHSERQGSAKLQISKSSNFFPGKLSFSYVGGLSERNFFTGSPSSLWEPWTTLSYLAN